MKKPAIQVKTMLVFSNFLLVFTIKTLFHGLLHGSVVSILLQYDLRQKKPQLLPIGAKTIRYTQTG